MPRSAVPLTLRANSDLIPTPNLTFESTCKAFIYAPFIVAGHACRQPDLSTPNLQTIWFVTVGGVSVELEVYMAGPKYFVIVKRRFFVVLDYCCCCSNCDFRIQTVRVIFLGRQFVYECRVPLGNSLSVGRALTHTNSTTSGKRWKLMQRTR